MCAAGTIASGLSMLPTVTSTEFGRAVSRKVSAVPQAGHSWRTAPGVAQNSAGVPAVKTSAVAGKVAQVTNGAPVMRRQIPQWQWLTSRGAAPSRYRTAPQKHPPCDFRGSCRGRRPLHPLEGAHPVCTRERAKALAGVESSGALVVRLDLQVDGNRASLGRDAERSTEQAGTDATSPGRGLDIELLEPRRPIGVLEWACERECRYTHGPSRRYRDQDPTALAMTEHPLDRAGDLHLRGLHVVLAELCHEERRHRFELGLGGRTDLDCALGHGTLDAGPEP
jgi:hypothetical protein